MNDTYGHQCGDEVIRYVASLLNRGALKHGGIAGRYGGEEFVVAFFEKIWMKRIISLRTFIIRFGVRKLFTKENIFQFVPALVWQVIRRLAPIRENF